MTRTALAHVLSDVFAPAVSVSLICVVAGTAEEHWGFAGIAWGLAAAFFCALVPTIAIHLGVRRRRITDRHVTRRDQRWPIFLVCVVSVLCCLCFAFAFKAPALLVHVLLTMLAGLAIAVTATLLGLKVSMHAFCFTALGALVAVVASPWWTLALLALLPVVAFARLQLRHHTLAEVILGAGLGASVMLASQLFR